MFGVGLVVGNFFESGDESGDDLELGFFGFAVVMG
jgi:hypothetical protein